MEYAQALRRSATITVIAVAIFEIITDSKNQTIQVASFTVARNSVVFVFLPSFVAYCFFQITVDQNRAFQVSDLYEEAFSLWSAKGEKNDLDTPILGSSPLYWSINSGHYHKGNISKADKVEDHGSLVMMIFIFVGIIVFEFQAYYVLFTSKNFQIGPCVASLGVTIFCLTMGILSFSFMDTGTPKDK